MGSQRIRAGVGCAFAMALLIGGARCGPGKNVVCSNLTSGYSVVHRGRGALDACIRDAAMQIDGELRIASVSGGHFDFGAGARWELGSGWTLEGRGAARTFVHASLATGVPGGTHLL